MPNLRIHQKLPFRLQPTQYFKLPKFQYFGLSLISVTQLDNLTQLRQVSKYVQSAEYVVIMGCTLYPCLTTLKGGALPRVQAVIIPPLGSTNTHTHTRTRTVILISHATCT